MQVRTFEESPSLGGLYAKAVLPAVPGVGRRFGGRRSAPAAASATLPELELRLPGIGLDARHLTRYNEVCGFARRGAVPATYPHVLAFPLQLALMTDPAFPFEVMGLVHVRNRIEQQRSLSLDDTVELRVRSEGLGPHPRGTTMTLVSEVVVDGSVLWRDDTVYLRRHRVAEAAASQPASALPAEAPSGPQQWRLPGNLGRRYAAVSGDRNPIHLSTVTAKAFGFPRTIAHGMWTKARSLAALEQRVPAALAVEVEFRKPIHLPGTVSFGAREDGTGLVFGVSSAPDRTHLVGRLAAL